MNLYERVTMGMKKMPQLSPAGGNDNIVPVVTHAREEDKGIPTVTIGITTNSNNTSHAQVTIGTVLVPGEKSAEQPTKIKNTQWDQSAQELINWFKTTPRIIHPFHFENHRSISSPEKFYGSIERDIAAGPSGARNRYGALINDIRMLQKITYEYNFHKSELKETDR